MPVQEEEEEEEAKEEDEEEKEARPCPRAAVERAASPLALSDDTGSTAMSLSELEKYSATALCNSVAASSCPRQAFFMNAATCSSYFFFFIFLGGKREGEKRKTSLRFRATPLLFSCQIPAHIVFNTGDDVFERSDDEDEAGARQFRARWGRKEPEQVLKEGRKKTLLCLSLFLSLSPFSLLLTV